MRAAALGAARGAPFTARAAAAWLRDARGLSSDAAGAALGALQAAQLLTTADPAAADVALSAASVEQQPGLSLRLVADCPQPSRWKEPLNGQFTWFGPARPAAEVGEEACSPSTPIPSPRPCPPKAAHSFAVHCRRGFPGRLQR
jgi:hypothetical protein